MLQYIDKVVIKPDINDTLHYYKRDCCIGFHS